jgi:polysaccharide pyruvyl transferase WcaK-like protein
VLTASPPHFCRWLWFTANSENTALFIAQLVPVNFDQSHTSACCSLETISFAPADDVGTMDILIEPSDYVLLNVGDMAMLQASFSRLSTLWPEPYIQIFTDEPQQLAIHCQGAVPLETYGRQLWFAEGYLFGSLKAYLPRGTMEPLWQIERSLRRRFPSMVVATMQSRMKARGVDVRPLHTFWQAITQADVLVVAGMGGITDAFQTFAYELLDTLDLAIRHDVPTVLFGQGLGPIDNPKLRARARAVLPRVSLIALREGRAGQPLLQQLGVEPDRVIVTGDDAIEIAYQARGEYLGNGIGVNVRVGRYAHVDTDQVTRVGQIVQEAARRHHASIVPVPISRYPVDADAAVIRRLTARYPDVLHGWEDLDTPLKVIQQIQQCRIVVTGSYHAAVFALSQGIPAIGLANSAYYADKFLGLAEQFGVGCEVVFMNDINLPARLIGAITQLWEAAGELRPHLLEAAERQVGQSRAAYQRAFELVAARKKTAPAARSRNAGVA